MTASRRPPLVPVDVIVRGLAARAPELCAQLFPGGAREGHEFRIGSLAGEPGRSMAVHLGGARAGVWSDFASGESGDALDLVTQALFAGDKRQGIRWALTWLGLAQIDIHELEVVRRQAEQRASEAQAQAIKETEGKRRAAQKIWLAGAASLRGTPAERYLLGRGIDLAALGRQPRSLRFHPHLWNEESQGHWPALVATIVDAGGDFVAVHRTWLEVNRDGRVSKAPLKDPKLTLGTYRGGAIRLWRGASGKALKDAPIGETVDFTEGIEDGLSVAIAAPECRVLVAVALANMANIELPPAIAVVRIWAQNDAAESRAARGLERAERAHQAQGRRILRVRVPAEFKDVNDLLRAPLMREDA